MKGYSADLRERVVAGVITEGISQVAAARRFGISRASVGCYVRAWQAGQESLEPRASTGRPRKLRLAEHREALRESLESDPDLDLAGRREQLAQGEGVYLSVPTLWRALRALGFTRKKRP